MKVKRISPNQLLVLDNFEKIYKVNLSKKPKFTISCICDKFIFYNNCEHIETVRLFLEKENIKVEKKSTSKDSYEFILKYKEQIKKMLEN